MIWWGGVFYQEEIEASLIKNSTPLGVFTAFHCTPHFFVLNVRVLRFRRRSTWRARIAGVARELTFKTTQLGYPYLTIKKNQPHLIDGNRRIMEKSAYFFSGA